MLYHELNVNPKNKKNSNSKSRMKHDYSFGIRGFSLLILLSLFACNGTERPTQTKENTQKKIDYFTTANDASYAAQLKKHRSKLDSGVVPVIIDTLSTTLMMYSFDIDDSKRLAHHLKKFQREEAIHTSLSDWYQGNFNSARYNYDQNLAKFYFYTTTTDSIFNHFMSLCIIDRYTIIPAEN